jgi:glycosyltransferase involved in cell wall biosynthesis
MATVNAGSAIQSENKVRPVAQLRRVSVVIPTHNRRALLARTLASVLAQDGVEVAAVVVDEASTDGTADYLASLGERVAVVRHDEPRGVAAARNAGLERVEEEWVAFVDDDDVWAPSKLAAQLDVLAAQPDAEWSCAGAVVVDSDLKIVGLEAVPPTESLVERLLAYNAIPGGGSGVVARTAVLRDLGGFDPELRVVADWDLWIRLALRSPPALVDRPLVGYVRHGDSMSRDLAAIRRELEHVAAKHARARAERGLAFAWDRWLVWAAAMHRRAGRRRDPAAIYARLALQRRRPSLLAKAALAAVWPGWIRIRDRLAARDVPPEWAAEAERWLEPLRGGTLRDRARGESSPDEEVAQLPSDGLE